MPAQQEPESEPTELDRLDPSPEPARPPRRPPRRRGPVETGVRKDITRLPEAMRKGGIAAAALALAAELDTGHLPPRESAGHAREIRQCLTTLAEMAPGDARGDQTDEVRQARERRLMPAQG
jgi:hypothetical protein